MKFYERKAELAALLPDMLAEAAELAAVCEAAGSEIEIGNALIAKAADDAFISTAGSQGISRWEKILGVSSPLDSTLEARRDALIARLMTKPPINLYVLKSIIEAYMGLEVELEVRGFYVYASYRGESRIADLRPLYKTVYEAIPANMLLEISYRYLVWNELDSLDMTFDELDARGVAWADFEKGEWIDG